LKSDFCPILGFDHLELYVGNAKQSAVYYARAFGFRPIGYRGLETGSRDCASYILRQGRIRLVLTSALGPDHPASPFVARHGDGVAVIALEVEDAAVAFEETTHRGARAAQPTTALADGFGMLRQSAIQIYGDTRIVFVERKDYSGLFAPGFQPLPGEAGDGEAGLISVDHIVGNVALGEMDTWARFFAETMGFSQLVHFDDKTISTEYSALMSKVMQDGSGRIKFPINEPAIGKRASQIQEYLDYNHGPGVQHVACSTSDIIQTVSRLRENGVQFLSVPAAYYEALEARVGRIDEPVSKLAELGILVDRDEEGYLLQIFSEPVADRPTLFFEIIERHGARGFGEGNFRALFESIEREQARRGNL
jgi:4-hydroxyphenylpyruvate dioxygenase